MSDERLIKQAEADWHLANHWEKRFETTVEERDFYKEQYERLLAERQQRPGRVEADIERMRAQGSSLILNWGEDTGCWEVDWISSGKRYGGNSDTLDDALYCARIAARNDLEGIADD